MERRNRPQPGSPPLVSKGMELPSDYLKMVSEVFATQFDAALKLLAQEKRKARFSIHGAIYPNEIRLSAGLVEEGKLVATTLHASADFDPTASSPTAEELLGSCVDALASLYSELLPAAEPEKIRTFSEQPLADFEDVPFVWTPMPVNKRQVFLKLDKANPDVEEMTEKWLLENDPKYRGEEEEERKSDEELLKARLQAGKSRKKDDPTRH